METKKKTHYIEENDVPTKSHVVFVYIQIWTSFSLLNSFCCFNCMQLHFFYKIFYKC